MRFSRPALERLEHRALPDATSVLAAPPVAPPSSPTPPAIVVTTATPGDTTTSAPAATGGSASTPASASVPDGPYALPPAAPTPDASSPAGPPASAPPAATPDGPYAPPAVVPAPAASSPAPPPPAATAPPATIPDGPYAPPAVAPAPDHAGPGDSSTDPPAITEFDSEFVECCQYTLVGEISDPGDYASGLVVSIEGMGIPNGETTVEVTPDSGSNNWTGTFDLTVELRPNTSLYPVTYVYFAQASDGAGRVSQEVSCEITLSGAGGSY
jgi:hypothetical protein